MSIGRRAIIIGSEGQDGSILWNELVVAGWSVLGIGRSSVRCTETWDLGPVDIQRESSVDSAVKAFRPNRVFHLAARHRSADELTPLSEGDELREAFGVHSVSLEYFVGAITRHVPQAHIFYAASSHIFSGGPSAQIDENSVMAPLDAYGVTKAAGVLLCRRARASGLHASAAFLFNHESESRRSIFVSQRIVRGAWMIKRGVTDRLELGDLSARVDWGYAPDFVAAIRAISELEIPDEYVVATGAAKTVADFARLAFSRLDLDWKNFVHESPSKIRKEHRALVGNSSKLRRATGWMPSISFEEMVVRLVDAEKARLAACEIIPQGI